MGDGAANGGNNGAANGQFDDINTNGEFNRIVTTLNRVGLVVPSTNTTTSYQYSFTGAYSGTQIVPIALWHTGVDGNYLRFSNVPIDLAYALDQMIDGQMDAGAGTCILPGAAAGANWGIASGGGTVTVAVLMVVP